MGMSVGENKGGAMAEMNVVPLIDILRGSGIDKVGLINGLN